MCGVVFAQARARARVCVCVRVRVCLYLSEILSLCASCATRSVAFQDQTDQSLETCASLCKCELHSDCLYFCRLNAYGCLPTSHSEGVIEIVLNSNTLANIQKMYGTFRITSGFNKESLWNWLKSHNRDEER